MKDLSQKERSGTTLGQKGFTLVELLVVIGIIVALAGVTVPLITKFTGSGKTGAMAAETQTVQTAMNAMMAEQDITTVTAVEGGGGNATNIWGALPAGTGAIMLYGTLGNQYLKQVDTDYYYCWTAGGLVYPRVPDDPEASDDSGLCDPAP